mgnify:CR=1 FL=1
MLWCHSVIVVMSDTIVDEMVCIHYQGTYINPVFQLYVMSCNSACFFHQDLLPNRFLEPYLSIKISRILSFEKQWHSFLARRAYFNEYYYGLLHAGFQLLETFGDLLNFLPCRFCIISHARVFLLLPVNCLDHSSILHFLYWSYVLVLELPKHHLGVQLGSRQVIWFEHCVWSLEWSH